MAAGVPGGIGSLRGAVLSQTVALQHRQRVLRVRSVLQRRRRTAHSRRDASPRHRRTSSQGDGWMDACRSADAVFRLFMQMQDRVYQTARHR